MPYGKSVLGRFYYFRKCPVYPGIYPKNCYNSLENQRLVRCSAWIGVPLLLQHQLHSLVALDDLYQPFEQRMALAQPRPH